MKRLNSMENEIRDPCGECLVRACCRGTCALLYDYVSEVLNVLADNPNHSVLDAFNEEQQADLLRFAKRIRENKPDKIKQDTE